MAALDYAVSEQIATITLNRPERMNTISREMLDELCAVLNRAKTGLSGWIAANPPAP